jgi:maltose alpha-D-glucosyltransferase / alpha-amylase
MLIYGDEIGMGEQLELKDRLAVRVPMQWSPEPSAGFSTAAPDDLVRPLASDPFGPDHVSVEAQRPDPDSLLNWMERAIRRRKESPELGWGSVTLLETPQPSILAHRCDWENGTIVAVHNLAEEPARATLELGEDVTGAENVLELRDHPVGDGGRIEVELGRYGHLWLRPRRG